MQELSRQGTASMKCKALPSFSPFPSPLVTGAAREPQYHQKQIPPWETLAGISSTDSRAMRTGHSLLFSFLSVSAKLALVAKLGRAPLPGEYLDNTPLILSGGVRAANS